MSVPKRVLRKRPNRNTASLSYLTVRAPERLDLQHLRTSISSILTGTPVSISALLSSLPTTYKMPWRIRLPELYAGLTSRIWIASLSLFYSIRDSSLNSRTRTGRGHRSRCPNTHLFHSSVQTLVVMVHGARRDRVVMLVGVVCYERANHCLRQLSSTFRARYV